MRTARFLCSWNDASLEDRLEAADGRATVDAFRGVGGRKHCDTKLTRSKLSLVSVQAAVPRRCKEIASLLAANQSLVVALGNADPVREKILSDCLLHWDVNAQQPDSPSCQPWLP